MPCFRQDSNYALFGFFALVFLVDSAYAFGAGNINSLSKIDGKNWRHGDITDVLLGIAMAKALGGKNFEDLDVSRVYFGNFLRDYSQAIDTAALKFVPAEAVRLIVGILGFFTFGYGSGEFEVTAERLGCYRPEEHIDNPKDYADNMDASQVDSRLRKPVDEGRELPVDAKTGLKNYIAKEGQGYMTSAEHARKLLKRSVELGRDFKRTGNKESKYEAFILMGNALHCLEDFFAHSNYIELVLIELGEQDVFPHVGGNTRLRIEGVDRDVWPITTGTFGGVDFLHSVTGEVSDKLSQNELTQLEGALQQSSRVDTSKLQQLIDMIPDSIIGRDKKGKVNELKANGDPVTPVSPKNAQEFTEYVRRVRDRVMPVIIFHDELLKAIGKAIDQIPVLPKIVDELQSQLTLYVFTLIAPNVVPLIGQIKTELATGSNQIIKSSEDKQFVVFDNDNSSDPTHSMISKDHFSNILNEPAGQTASKVVEWVVPQLMNAWDDDNVNLDQLTSRIVYGVLHHPAQRGVGPDNAQEGRQLIFKNVQDWWSAKNDDEKNDYRRKLTKDGVRKHENHVGSDSGHGCSGPLKLHQNFAGGKIKKKSVEDRIASAAATYIVDKITDKFSSYLGGHGVSVASTNDFKTGNVNEQNAGGVGGITSQLQQAALNRQERQGQSGYGRQEQNQSYGEDRQQQFSGRQGQQYGRQQQYGGRQEQQDGRQERDGYGGSRQDQQYGQQERDEYGGGRQEQEQGRYQQGQYGRQGFGGRGGGRDQEEGRPW